MISGPAIPVYIVPDAELQQNGGSIAIQGGPAIQLANAPSSNLISTDADNQLEEGSDGKLFVPGTGCLKYVALLNQSGSSAPVATVLENTLGGTVVWTRSEAGTYLGTLAGAFPAGKTILPNQLNGQVYIESPGNYSLYLYRNNDNSLGVQNYSWSSSGGDSLIDSITNLGIVVYVYP